MKRIFLGFSFLSALTCAVASESFAQAPKAPAGKFGNVAGITAAQLRNYLSFVASDEMAGRNTPSPGLRTTALFLVSHLSRWGFKPGGENGTFFQNLSLRHSAIDPAATFAELGPQRFNYGEDFLAQYAAGEITGAMVYVNQCWTIPNTNIFPDDSIAVRDKIIVTHAGYPPGAGYFQLYGKKPGVDYQTPADYARRRGAKGLIFIPNFQQLSTWPQTRRKEVREGAWAVEKFQAAQAAPVPAITASLHMLAAIFKGEAEGAAALFRRGIAENEEAVPSFALQPEKKIRCAVAVKNKNDETQNVVAIWEGSDGKLKNEYVALGAHYDHVGIGVAVAGDSIYNGADDDGSGTAALLAIAEAWSQGPRPRRSLLLVWHTGEEQGLWGSRYFVDHPVIPLDRIVAHLNLDMVGRSRKPGDAQPGGEQLTGPDEIYVIGSKMMSTHLGELSERVNQSFLQLAFNYKYDDPLDPNRFFFRSDHYHYARKGIPIIFYFNGVHEDYHKPSDHIDKIDFQKMEKVARTVFATAWELANLPKRPVVDKKLPEMLAE